MDALIFMVGDMHLGVPFDRVALSASFIPAKLKIDETGTGQMTASFPVIDLRRKFNFPAPPGEKDIRLITVVHNGQSVGLVINPDTPAVILRNAEVKPMAGTRHPGLLGVVTYQDEPVVLVDMDRLPGADATMDMNDLFAGVSWEEPVSRVSQFIDMVRYRTETGAFSSQDIRHLAQEYGVPLSLAYRLITFYALNTEDVR